MTWLLDGNVLSALAITTHEHHRRAHAWYVEVDRFATCAITQGTLLRVHMLMAEDQSAAAAWRVLDSIAAIPRHEFWDDGFSYMEVAHRLLQGPKQVSDAWLVQLSRKRNGKLATLDGSLAALHKGVAFLVPV
jgi:toxin-antitoxin system PIN domain toxin